MGHLGVFTPGTPGAPQTKMDGNSALKSTSALGMWNGQLAIKLHGGRRMAGGSRMVRICICEKYLAGSLETDAPQLDCPACSLLVRTCDRVRAGQQLLPPLTGPGFANRPRCVAVHLGRERAERLGICSIRRRAARAILVSGGCSSQVLTAGQYFISISPLIGFGGIRGGGHGPGDH